MTKKLYLQQKKRFCQKIFGTQEKPRLSVFRSHKHIYAQLIDDSLGHTLGSASTLSKNFVPSGKTSSKESSSRVGENIARIGKEKNIAFIAFDTGRKPYAGRIASLADGARTGGLRF
jgi:large subunit ribosomal protein L18